MIVCVCQRISDRDILRAAHDGVGSFEALQSRTGLGTACGACVECARKTWDEACDGAAAAPVVNWQPAGSCAASA